MDIDTVGTKGCIFHTEQHLLVIKSTVQEKSPQQGLWSDRIIFTAPVYFQDCGGIRESYLASLVLSCSLVKCGATQKQLWQECTTCETFYLIMYRIQQCVTALAKRHDTPKTLATAWIERIVEYYVEPHRHYHTLEHIESMFNFLARYQDICDLEDKQAVDLAAIFHDIVYDPISKENETQSIEVFKAFAAEVGLPQLLCEKVCTLIARTIRHELEPGDDLDTRAFLDSDLEVLSRVAGEYQRYATQVRAEYSQYSEKDYCEGRIKILTNFLQRPQIYLSETFPSMESKARLNIRTEIHELEQKLLARHDVQPLSDN